MKAIGYVALVVIAVATSITAVSSAKRMLGEPAELAPSDVERTLRDFFGKEHWNLDDFQGLYHGSGSESATAYFIASRPPENQYDKDTKKWGWANLFYLRDKGWTLRYIDVGKGSQTWDADWKVQPSIAFGNPPSPAPKAPALNVPVGESR